jgi:hypothetical protein
VAFEDAGILLPGNKGAGKTTLVAYLVKNGFEYFSDEVGAVDLQSMKMVPFPRPLNIKGRTDELLQPLGTELEIGRYGEGPTNYKAKYALPSSVLVGREFVGITFLIFPRYVPGGKTSLVEVTRAEAALGIMRYAFNFPRLREKGFLLATEIARRAPAYRLEYENLDEAVDAIREIMEGREARNLEENQPQRM